MRSDLLVAAMAIIIFALADAVAAAWGKFDRWWWGVATIVAGNIAWLLFAYLNRSWPLATASGVVNVGLSVAGILVGWLAFGERLRPLEKAGVVLGLLAMSLFVVARFQSDSTASPASLKTESSP